MRGRLMSAALPAIILIYDGPLRECDRSCEMKELMGD